ncbi:LysR family transcriptional regulator [Klebsiella michiganensis]|uniref:LysR family transcriptional regulator n=1 Tax=Klebsiella michiganensis TaxID=1134687 RepID=UPI0029592117|nr:LysR family transcriptional regulator [Klebsiella pneumoniae]
MPVRPTLRLSRSDLADLNAFRAVERARSFTQAAVELGLTTSALSHAIRNLETRLGVRLLNRTSRTVSPTDSGLALAKRLNIGFSEISEALDELNAWRENPVGRIRLNVLSDGARLIVAPHLPTFLQRYPQVQVDDRMVDIVAEGFDAGIRFGGTIADDFVAVKLGEPLKWVAVASPRYLYHHAEPMRPEDLLHHACIQIRTGQGTIYKWEFRRGEEYRAIDVPGQVCVGETTMGIELALAGTGITYCLEKRVEPWLRSGELRVVMAEWAPMEPAMYLYYPGNRTVPPGLRELIEVLRDGMAA